MTDTVFPKIVPTGYSGDYQDFIVRVKADRSGALRVISGSVLVSSGTTLNTNIGLAPFTKGAKLVTGASQIFCPNWDSGTTVSVSVGYLYSDTTSAGANAASNTSAYASSQTVVNTTFSAVGGLIPLGGTSAGTSLSSQPGVTAQTYDLLGDGWFVVTPSSTVTNGAAAAVNYSLVVAYDQSGVQN